MFAWHLGFKWNTVERVRVVAAYAVVLCTLYVNTLTSILSPREFQLPTIHVGWCFYAVMLYLVGFQLLTLRAGWSLPAVNYLQSLSSEFSTASLSLIHSNLVSLSLEVSFLFFCVLFHCKVACISVAVWVACLARSLTLSFSIFRSFGPLSLQHIGLCLFLRHHRSSCSCADWASLGQLKWKASRVLPLRSCFRYFARTDRRAQCFGLKEFLICIYGTTYIRQIYKYEKSTVQLASVGLAQASPNYIHIRLPQQDIPLKQTALQYTAKTSWLF